MNGLYNKNVYWTEDIQFAIDCKLNHRYKLKPTKHMFNRIRELRLPNNCYKAMLYGEVVEVEFCMGEVKKIVTRLSNRYQFNKDICAVILFDKDNTAIVKTIWVNSHKDTHKTIHIENYIRE